MNNTKTLQEHINAAAKSALLKDLHEFHEAFGYSKFGFQAIEKIVIQTASAEGISLRDYLGSKDFRDSVIGRMLPEYEAKETTEFYRRTMKNAECNCKSTTTAGND